MKIIKASYEIMQLPEYSTALSLLEAAARTCYKSEDKIEEGSAARVLLPCMANGHDSVIEHIGITVRLIVDRGVSHEVVRHRLASFCLSGETVIPGFKNKKSWPNKDWTLEQMARWQEDPKRKGKLKLIRIRSLDSSGRIVPGKIKAICECGVQDVFEVTCKSGRKLKSTLKHRFLTPHGYKRLFELSEGDRVMANGMPALENREWLYDAYIEKNNTLVEIAHLIGCGTSIVTRALRRFGINKPLSMRKNRKPGRGRKGMFSKEARMAISARMSGEKNHRWKGDNVKPLAGNLRAIRKFTPDVCWGCGATENLERHHRDKNTLNNDKENILFLCPGCHKAFHFGQNVLTAFSDEIVSIRAVGKEKTYDLETENDPHNFVANGLVVHNSQESTRYANYSKAKFGNEITVIEPCFWEKGSWEYEAWNLSMFSAEATYLAMLERGAKPQEARSVLPNSLKTEIVVTANIREWRHILKLRCSPAAHPQIREVMIPLRKELAAWGPVFFGDLMKGVE